MDITTKLKAEGIAIALEAAVGKKPSVADMGDHIRIYWDKQDYPLIQSKVSKMIQKRDPGNIRIEWIPVVAPIAMKKVLPVAAGLLVVGFIIGKVL